MRFRDATLKCLLGVTCVHEKQGVCGCVLTMFCVPSRNTTVYIVDGTNCKYRGHRKPIEVPKPVEERRTQGYVR